MASSRNLKAWLYHHGFLAGKHGDICTVKTLTFPQRGALGRGDISGMVPSCSPSIRARQTGKASEERCALNASSSGTSPSPGVFQKACGALLWPQLVLTRQSRRCPHGPWPSVRPNWLPETKREKKREGERVREGFITTKAGGSEIKAALGISEQQRLSDFKRGVRYWKMVTPD